MNEEVAPDVLIELRTGGPQLTDTVTHSSANPRSVIVRHAYCLEPLIILRQAIAHLVELNIPTSGLNATNLVCQLTDNRRQARIINFHIFHQVLWPRMKLQGLANLATPIRDHR